MNSLIQRIEDWFDRSDTPERPAESNTSEADGASETPIDHRTDEWPFAWSEDEVLEENGTEIVSRGRDEHGQEQTFAGPVARHIIESHQEKPDEPITLGIDSKPQPYGARYATIPFDRMDKHMGLFGASGAGKSVLLGNGIEELLYKGTGLFCLDGSDEGALIDHILARVPPHRRDDIVIIDPGADNGRCDYASGFNLLHIDLEPGDPGYESLVDSRRAVLRDAICGKHGGGAIIDSVTDTMIRIAAMTDINFAVADIRYAIFDEESRERLKDLCDALELDKKFLDFYRKIADDYDDDDLSALERRLKKFVEDPRTMRVISDRSSTLSLEQLMREQKIVFFRLGLGDDLKLMLSQLTQQWYWNAVERRADETLSHERDLHLFCVDEAHDVISETGFGDTSGTKAIKRLLREGRKKDAGAVICTQRPNQLPSDVIDEMAGNADTIVTFRLEEDKDQRLVSKLLDIDQDWLKGEGDYMARMTAKDTSKRERSAAFRFYSFPEYPPFLTDDEVDELYHAKLREHGSPVLTHEEIADELLFHDGDGLLEAMSFREYFEREGIEYNEAALRRVERNGESAPTGETDDETDGDRRTEIYRAVWDSQLTQAGLRGDPEAIPFDAIEARLRDYLDLPEDVSDQRLSGIFETVIDPEGYVRRTDDGRFSVTPEEIDDLELAVSGEGESAGKREHRQLLADARDTLARLGCDVSVETQAGEGPDGLADHPPGITIEGTPFAVRRALAEFENEHPVLYALSNGTGAEFTVEAETKTVRKYRRERTTENARKAVGAERVCLFFTSDSSVTYETKPPKHDARKAVDAVEQFTDIPREHINAIVMPHPLTPREGALDEPQLYRPDRDDLVPLADVTADVFTDSSITDDEAKADDQHDSSTDDEPTIDLSKIDPDDLPD